MSVGTFSVGIQWKYDIPKWRENAEKDRDHPLFVNPQYKDLKEEIQEYEDITMEEYNKDILPKATQFHKTKMAKALQHNKESISLESIICIILYTDYTEHSSHFTATFRKNSPFEPLQATKRRHAKYYWCSKILRRTIGIYGTDQNGINYEKRKYEHTELWSLFKPLAGPFYCGMSMVMSIPEFGIKLSSPTSTSCQIAVAMKFSGDKGIIMEFNNTSGKAKTVRGFDVSWISRFKEEDERYL